MYEYDNIYDEITRQFEFINDEISSLMGSQMDSIKSIEKYLNQDQEIIELKLKSNTDQYISSVDQKEDGVC